MDILSYTKASRAKRTILDLNRRLGVGEYKNGAKDVKNGLANVKARIEQSEKLRQGISEKEILFDKEEDFKGLLSKIEIENDKLILSRDYLVAGVKANKIMISNLADGDTATASLNGENAWLAFDGTNQDFQVDTLDEFWVQYEFNEPKMISSYQITGGFDRLACPTNGTLSGSNDGEDFKQLHRFSGMSRLSTGAAKTFSMNPEEKFKYYRLTLSGSGHDEKSSIGEITLYEPSYVDSGSWVSNEIILPEDAIEIKGIELIGTNISSATAKAYLKTENDSEYKAATSSSISSTFGKKIKIKVEIFKAANPPVLDSVTIKYKSRSILNRLSDVEKNTHININKHNLRMSAILKLNKYSLRELIVDDIQDTEGIDLELSTGVIHDVFNKLMIGSTSRIGEVITTATELSYDPMNFTISIAHGGPYVSPPEAFISLNDGEDWAPMELEKIHDIREIVSNRKLRVKVLLHPGQELQGISYSWV